MFKIKKTKSQKISYQNIIIFLSLLFVSAQVPTEAFAQFKGGSFGGDKESSIGSDIYSGGPQQGSSSANSASGGSLSHNAAAKLSFSVSPSSVVHTKKMERQPIVVIQDASGNTVTSDNTTQVTIAILNNPGASELEGTTTIRAINGVVSFTDLKVYKPGEQYTFIATAAGLSSAVSAPFDIFPATGADGVAVLNYTTGSASSATYTVYGWVETDNNIQDLDGTNDTCHNFIVKDNSGATAETLTTTIDTTNDWCKSASWQPSTNDSTVDNYFAVISITLDTVPYKGIISVDLTSLGEQTQYDAVNWDDIAAIRAQTDTINWTDVTEILADTATINWDDVGVLKSNVASIKGVTDRLELIGLI